MAPSTNIGAAHPVSMGGRSMSFKKIKEKLSKGADKEDSGRGGVLPPKSGREDRAPTSNDEVLGDKILNDTVAWVTGIAESRKRNVDWAVRSVKDSISSTAEEAKKAGVVEYVAKDVSEFLLMAEGSKVKLPSGEHVLSLQGQAVVESPLSFRQQILNVLVNPNIAYILMMLGFYGLLFEVTHPGAGFPGVAGAVSLILALYAFHTLPTNYAGMALIALSLVLFIAEVKVTSYGFLALGGIICLSLGSLFLIDTPYDFMKVSLSVILPTVLSTAFIFLFLTTLVVKAQSRGVMGGIEGMIGHVALADTDLSPTGKVFIDGEIWDAQSLDGQAIAKGDKVVIASQDGMMLNVRKS
jgi:membrane-bound serine protease (ClpP class)